MIECFHCHQSNRTGAFFCKQCGRPIVCPRCRTILEKPLNYCDNCGQPLVTENELPPVFDELLRAVPAEADRPESRPPSRAPEPIDGQPLPSENASVLEQFVPRQLLRKLESARSKGTMVGERRVVTILFCDVKGSTAAADSLDPEEWTEIINGAFKHMIKPVYEYEGTVARLMGDGILAFFGAPITHEDDPQRAVLAGLDIISGIEAYREDVKERWGIDFEVRIGINTGRVVVGAVGSDLRMEYTAMGDAINVASRMEQTAAPGTVQVADETYRLVAPLFEFEDLGAISVKGKGEPVPAYRALGRSKTPGRVRGIEGLEIEMIGRDLELATLQSAIDDVRRGVGRIVSVVGEAGLGKSRLIDELKKSLSSNGQTQASISAKGPSDQNGNALIWHETASLSYETSQPYAIFRRLIRRLEGITYNDPPSTVREKLAPLAGVVSGGDGSEKALSVFEALFGLEHDNGQSPLTGEAFRSALFELMPRLWNHYFQDKPSVLVFEDLHWSDPASVTLLQEQLKLAEELAIVILCVLRPVRDSPGWQIKEKANDSFHHRYSEVVLRPLSDSQSNNMIDALLRQPDLPVELRQRILDRAGGNPFFIEEVIRTLINEGVIIPEKSSNGHAEWRFAGREEDLEIPDNLQSLLTSRIDSLSDDVRQTMQAASVIGRNFYRRILKLILDEDDQVEAHLAVLLAQDMIRESARVPELEYRFRNPLTQEAAYRTILLKRRRALHKRVAEVMESIYSDQMEEQAPRLAYHYREARQFGKAIDCYRRSGDAAYRLFANEEAATQYGLAIEMAQQAGEQVSADTLIHLYSRRGRSLEHQVAYGRALQNYQSMLSQAEERQYPEMSLAAMMAMATLFSVETPFQDIARSQELSQEALALAQSLNDRAAEAKIYWNLLNTVAFSRGDVEQGLAYGKASLELARELNLKEQIAFTLNSMAIVYLDSAQIDKGQELLREVRAIWKELDNKPMIADSYSMAGYSYLMSGEYKNAVESFGESIKISETINNPWNETTGKVFIGLTHLEMGDISRGVSFLEEGIKRSEATGLQTNVLLGMVILSGCYATLGALESARSFAEQAYARRDEVSSFNQPLLLGLIGASYVRIGALSEAREVINEAVEFEGKGRSLWFDAFIIGAECELLLAEGENAEVLRIINPYISLLRKSGIHSELAYFHFLVGKAHMNLNEFENAFSSFRKGLAASEYTGEKIWRWQILRELVNLEGMEETAEIDDNGQWQENAAQTMRYIASTIEDPKLLEAFLNRPGVASLVDLDIPA